MAGRFSEADPFPWLPAKTAVEAVYKVDRGLVLSDAELALLRAAAGKREHAEEVERLSRLIG